MPPGAGNAHAAAQPPAVFAQAPVSGPVGGAGGKALKVSAGGVGLSSSPAAATSAPDALATRAKEPQKASPSAAALDNVRIYPNPVYASRPPQPPAVHIDRMPALAKVRIYNLSGHKIWDGSADAAGYLQWPVTNISGAQAASGIYLAVIDPGSGGRKVMKIAVIR